MRVSKLWLLVLGLPLAMGAMVFACDSSSETGEGESEAEAEAESEAEAEAEAEAESESESEGECPAIEVCAHNGQCGATDENDCPICFWPCVKDLDCPQPGAEGESESESEGEDVCFTCEAVSTSGGGSINVCRPVESPSSACTTGEPGMVCVPDTTAGCGENRCYTFSGWTSGFCSTGCEPPK